MKKRRFTFKHFFVPHKGNKYKPAVLAKESVAVIALVLIVIQGAYYIDSKVLLKNLGFTATVLPASLTGLLNTDRGSQGLGALTRDPLLDEVAQAKADDMAANGYFAHTSPQGKTPWYWLQKFEYPYTYAGENLAVDFDESQDVETAWMNSPAHRANILKPEYQYVGFGVAQGQYEGHQTTFVVEFFAAKKAAAATGKPVAAAAQSSSALKPQVLGAEISPAPVAGYNPFASLLASPRKLVFDTVLAVTVFIGLILIASLIFHIRKRYLHIELIVGGVALLVLGYAIMALNEATVSAVNIPHDTQSASAAAAF
jgi:hypothetical protein